MVSLWAFFRPLLNIKTGQGELEGGGVSGLKIKEKYIYIYNFSMRFVISDVDIYEVTLYL